MVAIATDQIKLVATVKLIRITIVPVYSSAWMNSGALCSRISARKPGKLSIGSCETSYLVNGEYPISDASHTYQNDIASTSYPRHV
jgi:hypothetical protein